MKWYFLREKHGARLLFACGKGAASSHFKEVEFVSSPGDAIGLRNTFPPDWKWEIWSLDQDKMKLEKLKL